MREMGLDDIDMKALDEDEDDEDSSYQCARKVKLELRKEVQRNSERAFGTRQIPNFDSFCVEAN